jgi:hypothetical protein
MGSSIVDQPVGSSFTYGLLVVRNTTADTTITLVSVTPVIDGDLRYLGALALGPERQHAAVQLDRSWPPTLPELAGASPVEGTRVEVHPGDRGVEILMGYEVTSSERVAVEAVLVDYVVDGVPYRGRFVNTIAICPAAATDDACAMEYVEE